MRSTTKAKPFRQAFGMTDNPPGRPVTRFTTSGDAIARRLVAQNRLQQQNDRRNTATFDRNTGTGGRFFQSPGLQQAIAAQQRQGTRFAGERMHEIFRRTDAAAGSSST